MLLVANTTLCLVLALVLFALPENRRQRHGYLIGFILTLGLIQLLNLISRFDTRLQVLSHLDAFFMYLIGVFLLAYVIHLTEGRKLSRRQLLLHCFPAIAILIIHLPLYWRLLAGNVIDLSPPVDPMFIFTGYYVHLMSYSVASLIAIKRHQQKIRLNLSNAHDQRLTWLSRLCWAVIALMLYDIVLGQVTVMFRPNWLDVHAAMVLAIMLVAIMLAFGAIRQPAILFEELVIGVGDKYQNSGLKPGSSQYLHEKLTTIMHNDRLFLDNELSLSRLAEAVNTTPHNLSQLLNETQQQSFYDYINQMRVEYAKRLLTESGKNVTEVAFESGFNNKASFYNAFKKWVGKTPVQWRKSEVLT